MHTTTILFWLTVAWMAFVVNAFDAGSVQTTVNQLIPKVNSGPAAIEKIEQTDEGSSRQQHHTGTHVNKISLGNQGQQQPSIKLLGTKNDATAGPAVLGLAKRRFVRRGGKKAAASSQSSSGLSDFAATKLFELDSSRQTTANPDQKSKSKKKSAQTQQGGVDKLMGKQFLKLGDPNDPKTIKSGKPAPVLKAALGGDPILTLTPPNNVPGPIKPAPAKPPPEEA